MRVYRSRFSHRRRRLRPEEQPAGAAEARPAAQPARLGPLYSAGPVHELPPHVPGAPRTADEAAAGPPSRSFQEQMPTVAGEGAPRHAVAFNRSGPLRLQGRTDATFDGGRFQTQNVTVRPGADCTGCTGHNCVHVTGTLEATYAVTTTVTLPRVADFPGLTPCQQRRVQDAIDNVLAPHEQQHVRAFEQYNGTTRRTFDLTLCRSAFDAAIQSMFQAEESARRAAAQAASDALDPFHFDVDLNCEEPRAATEGLPTPAIAAEPPPEQPEELPS